MGWWFYGVLWGDAGTPPKERQAHSSWPTQEGHVPKQQCQSQLSLRRASWHFFGAENRVLHIPGFLQSPEIAPSSLGADTPLCPRLNFPNSSQKLFKLPGGSWCCSCKGHSSCHQRAKNICRSDQRSWTFHLEVLKTAKRSDFENQWQETRHIFFLSQLPTLSGLQMQLYTCAKC